jgi:cytochrome P450
MKQSYHLRLREEVDRVLGQRSELTYQDITELKYCSAVFKETIRLWPPVAFMTRHCNQEWKVDGYRIPIDTTVFMSSYSNARNEIFFENAHEFQPERFLKDTESNKSM